MTETKCGQVVEVSIALPSKDFFLVRLMPKGSPAEGNYHSVLDSAIHCDGKKVTGPEFVRWLAEDERPVNVILTGTFGAEYPFVDRAEFTRC